MVAIFDHVLVLRWGPRPCNLRKVPTSTNLFMPSLPPRRFQWGTGHLFSACEGNSRERPVRLRRATFHPCVPTTPCCHRCPGKVAATTRQTVILLRRDRLWLPGHRDPYGIPGMVPPTKAFTTGHIPWDQFPPWGGRGGSKRGTRRCSFPGSECTPPVRPRDNAPS